MSNPTRILPNFADLEKLVLGYCILNGGYLDGIRGSMESDDFSTERHRIIWESIISLYDSGTAVDRNTMSQHIIARRKVDEVGGLGYVVDLDNMLPDRPAIDDYVEKLHEAKLRRRVIFAAQHIANVAYETTNTVEHVTDCMNASLLNVTNGGNGKNKPFSTHELIEKTGISELLRPRQESGLRLPWKPLQEALGGLESGQVVTLMAATSRGKTSMALQIATCCALQGSSPAIWTMEMSPKALFQRMVTQLSGVYATKRYATAEERKLQHEAVTRLDEYPIFFDYHSKTVASFIASLRQIRSRARLGLVIVDHLQLIRGAARNRANEVADNCGALAGAARELEVPMLILSQVDRASVKGDAEINIHSAKESGDIENNSDIVMWIKAPEFARDYDTAVSLFIGKQREGPTGFSIPMVFKPSTQSFAEVGE